MTTSKRNTKRVAVEAVSGDRDLMKALMKEALQEVLEGEMTEFLGAAPSERTEGRNGYRVLLTRARKGMVIFVPMGDLAGEDPTRDVEFYDAVWSFLKAFGAKDLVP